VRGREARPAPPASQGVSRREGPGSGAGVGAACPAIVDARGAVDGGPRGTAAGVDRAPAAQGQM